MSLRLKISTENTGEKMRELTDLTVVLAYRKGLDYTYCVVRGSFCLKSQPYNTANNGIRDATTIYLKGQNK